MSYLIDEDNVPVDERYNVLWWLLELVGVGPDSITRELCTAISQHQIKLTQIPDKISEMKRMMDAPDIIRLMASDVTE